MKSKFLLGLLLLIPSIVFSAHNSDRKLYATDIVNKSGTSVFRFPTTLPSANRVSLFNTDQQLTSSSVTDVELGYLSGVTSSIQTQLGSKYSGLPSQTGNSGKFLTTNGTSESWATVAATPSLTSTQIAFGDGSNLLTSNAGFNFDNTNKTLNIYDSASGGLTGFHLTNGVTANTSTDGVFARLDGSGNFILNNFENNKLFLMKNFDQSFLLHDKSSNSLSLGNNATWNLVLTDTQASFLNGTTLATTGSLPTCSSTFRGMLWNVQGGTGVGDQTLVCAKNMSNTYAWESFNVDYVSIAGANGTTTLTSTSARNINISGSSVGSMVLRLPPGNGISRGALYTITNFFSDANAITIAKNDGTTIAQLGPRNTMQFRSLDTTSAAGTWSINNLNSGSATYQTGLIPRITSFGVTEFQTFGQPLGLANSTATYTMATADNYADFIYSTNTAATGAKQLTLLANNNRLLWVYCGSTGRLNIAVTGGGTINGSSTWSLTQQGQAVLLQNDGANYKVIATQGDPLENITASTLAPAIYSSGFTLDTASNNITVTLPSAAESSFMKGKKFFFKRTSSGTNTITFNTTSSQTISGYASGVLTLLAQGDYFEFESDGSNWIITEDGRSSTIQNVATDTTLSALNKEMIITCDATAGNVTTTGYALSGRTGWKVTLKKVDASGNSCIYTAASGSGDGASVTLTTQNSGKTMAISGTNTYIVGSF